MGGKLQGEIEEVALQVDQAHILNNSMEKKARQFEKVVGEWKAKVDSLSMDLDVSQKECRIASSELFRVKNAYEEGFFNWMMSARRTRCSAMRSRTSWTR